MALDKQLQLAGPPPAHEVSSEKKKPSSSSSVQAPASVIITLLAFTFAMIIAPVGSYFLTVNTIYSGNSTYAGVTAAVVANLVLAAYLIVAFWEEPDKTAESKKNR